MIFPEYEISAALVVGSGLAGALEGIPVLAEVPYSSIPGLSTTTVPGHAGCFRLLDFEAGPVIAACGRTHLYEGRGMEAVAAGVRLLAERGVKSLLLTNASGGIRDDLLPGGLMRLTDHLNLLGCSPLEGAPDFVDMSAVYDESLALAMEAAAAGAGVPLAAGVYAAVRGPQYETPAEVRMLRTLGADAVGMSTVPEAIIARALGMRVAAISMISNRAAGLGSGKLDHREVVECGRKAAASLNAVFRAFLPRMVRAD